MVDITCVMVTGKTVNRYPMARCAVGAFLAQQLLGVTAKLLIVNDNPIPLLEPNEFADQNVEELHVAEQGMTLGELRNLAMDTADSPYMMQWDDDDHATPHRIAWQRGQTNFVTQEVTIFRREVHINLFDGSAFVNNGKSSRVGGFAGTMLWPLDGIRFPALGKHEDTEFLLKYKNQGRLRVLNNDPALYCRFWHGNNTWSKKHVLKRKPGSRNLDGTEQAVVDLLMKEVYDGVAEACFPEGR